LWKPWFKTGAGETRDSVGLSWFLGEYRDEKSVGHGGGDEGFNTYLVILPEKSMAVIVLCNYIPAPVSYISNAALDILLGFEPEDFTPPATIPIGKTLAEKGVDAAVAQWNSLKDEEPSEYLVNPRHFYFLMRSVLELDRVEDAKKLGLFCLEILPEPDIKNVIGIVKSHLKRNPDSKAGPAVMEIFNAKQ
ncbi:serine hydrolase, partial [Acidobacteriota bacterium]